MKFNYEEISAVFCPSLRVPWDVTKLVRVVNRWEAKKAPGKTNQFTGDENLIKTKKAVLSFMSKVEDLHEQAGGKIYEILKRTVSEDDIDENRAGWSDELEIDESQDLDIIIITDQFIKDYFNLICESIWLVERKVELEFYGREDYPTLFEEIFYQIIVEFYFYPEKLGGMEDYTPEDLFRKVESQKPGWLEEMKGKYSQIC